MSSASKHRKTSWNDKYSSEFGFIQKVQDDESRALCTICSSRFLIVHGGRRDILDHIKSDRHTSGVKAGSSSKKVSDYFQKLTATNEEQKVAGKEAVFAFHTAKHNYSFRSNDCTAGLIRGLYDPKFSLGKTKTAKLISKVLAPFIDKPIKEALSKANFVSLITDTSNHGNIKMLPIVVRYFDPVKGVVNKKLATVSIPNEQSETIFKEIVKVIREESLLDKVVAYAADNTNLNFGGVERNGGNNVWRKLQRELNRKIIGNGCMAHIAHNASGAGCEILEVDIEAIVVKIHKHFRIFTVPTEQFKNLCQDIDQVFMPTKSHSGTRFLTLEPAVKRIIEMFEPLKQYFLGLEKCAPVIRSFFNNAQGKFWVLFIVNQLKNISDSIKLIEASSTTSFEAFDELATLKVKLINRMNCTFLPTAAQSEYEKFDKRTQESIKDKVRDFYSTTIEYIDLWEKSVDGSEVFSWIILRKYPAWNDVEKSFKYAEDRYGKEIQSKIDRDLLFDEVQLMKSFVESNLNVWTTSKLALDEVWCQIFTHFRQTVTQLVNLERLVEFAFSLAGTSTEVERLFSLAKQIWSDQKSRLEIATLDSLLTIQFNAEFNCSQFYDMIKKDTVFLDKVHSSGKYD